MRYAAPADVTSINLSIGPVTVVDGFIDLPDELEAGDLAGLAVNGFHRVLPAPGDPEPTSE